MNIDLYTDGSIIGNPGGTGGWACVIVAAGRERILSGYETDTTSSRMELAACIEGLRAFTPCKDIIVHSDSEYVVLGFNNNRVNKWAANNWMRKSGPIPNSDLWRALSDRDLAHNVTWVHHRGRHEKPEALNGTDRCMALAHQFALSEARAAHHALRLGWREWTLPQTIEERTEFIAGIAQRERVPDPPAHESPVAWAVYQKASLNSDVVAVVSSPLGGPSLPDGGKQWCEDAATTMNHTDETEVMKKFRRAFKPRYVAMQYSGRRVEEAG